jgi:DNA-binding response OmpR family regulator
MESDGGPEPVPERPGQVRVAIIEDNVEIAELYAMKVKSCGMYLCFKAHDGEAGVKAFSAAAIPPDIVLIDHRMPVKSGLQAMREIKAMRPEVRFIFISADENRKNEALVAGASVFLTKPVGLMEIEAAMKKVMEPDR